MLRRTLSPILYTVTAEDVVSGNRRALAKAITLAESQNPDDAQRLGNLLREIEKLRRVSGRPIAPRIAFSGSPGAGKSTLIETLGMYLCEKKKLRVGVLAVDPSSTVTKGSILGDRTRMPQLSAHPNAYIRPSPSGCHLGGVTARGWEVMEILEAALFDVLLIETVGVGQSETQAKDITDLMVLLVPPAAGDELQGIKKGIVEVADLVAVTKYDGDKADLARKTANAYAHAVMYRAEQDVDKPVIPVSAAEGTNIEKMWDMTMDMWEKMNEHNGVDLLRRRQAAKHFLNYFRMELQRKAELMAGRELEKLGDKVWHRKCTPREAGDKLIDTLLHPVSQ